MAALVLPAILVVAALLVGPMVLLARISLNQYSATQLMIEATTAQNYLAAVADPYYRGVMGTTLLVALTCTALTLALGFPAAYRLARMESRWKSLVTVLTLIPLVVGNVVRAAGWLGLLGTDGLINTTLQALRITSAPLQLIYTPGAVVVGTIAVVLPYMILTLASVIESIPRAAEEAAANLGARPLTVFRRITLPMLRPGLVAAALFSFVASFENLELNLLLVGPGRTTLPVAMLSYLEFRMDPTLAAVASAQIVMVSALMLVTDRFVKLSRVV